MAKRGPKELSPEHKEAMQVGRIEGAAVRHYLEALRANKPKRGRKRTAESIRKQLDDIAAKLPDADPITALKMISDRQRYEAELAASGPSVDMASLEAEFVKVAKRYGERNDITYAAWREVGVAASVLAAAGIGRGT